MAVGAVSACLQTLQAVQMRKREVVFEEVVGQSRGVYLMGSCGEVGLRWELIGGPAGMDWVGWRTIVGDGLVLGPVSIVTSRGPCLVVLQDQLPTPSSPIQITAQAASD